MTFLRRFIWPWVLKKWAELRSKKGPPPEAPEGPPPVRGELRELISCNSESSVDMDSVHCTTVYLVDDR